VRDLFVLVLGFGLGIIPALVSYFFFTGNNTWDPSRVPFFVREFYLEALGLSGIPDYISAVLPYGLGLPTSQTVFSGDAQSILTWVLVSAFTITSVVGWIRALIARVWPEPLVIVATAWLSAVFAVMLFVTFVDTVWFYATSLAILFWITIGSLPTVIKPRALAVSLTCVLLAVEGVSMITQNWNYLPNLEKNIAAKSEYQNQIKETSSFLTQNGVEVIFGSYLDVIPISYGSSYELRPISIRYNRFPLTPVEASKNYTIAVKTKATDQWGEESLALVDTKCVPQGQLTSNDVEFSLYKCLGSDISGTL
jgi:hypothetical protein